MILRQPQVHAQLYEVFKSIPSKYDLINTLITWNMDKRWREKAARECLLSKPTRVLDLCCGTADLAITVSRLADYLLEVSGLDYSQAMLDIASAKASSRGAKRISFAQGEASSLPFPDASFDCIGISFAFRNLTYHNPLMKKHLSEILRVLAPGGRCVIVESSQPKSKIIRTLYHIYMRKFVFWTGWLISGNRQAYRYLAESSSRYYSADELQDLLIKYGFQGVSYTPLFFGVAGIHVAVK
jgi:demethylmenaquinone methyltransferase/2-methoxy-6-polyprenyl-1,4-benzoquinol methylase